MKKGTIFHASGSRKSAVARATIKPGVGKYSVNLKSIDEVSPEMYKLRMMEPVIIAGEKAKKYNIAVTVNGGGMAGQADAIRTAVSRALVDIFGNDMKDTFMSYDRTLLVSDIRVKESRKPNTGGKARSKVQKSYR